MPKKRTCKRRGKNEKHRELSVIERFQPDPMPASFKEYALRLMQEDGFTDWGTVPPAKMREYLTEYNSTERCSQDSEYNQAWIPSTPDNKRPRLQVDDLKDFFFLDTEYRFLDCKYRSKARLYYLDDDVVNRINKAIYQYFLDAGLSDYPSEPAVGDALEQIYYRAKCLRNGIRQLDWHTRGHYLKFSTFVEENIPGLVAELQQTGLNISIDFSKPPDDSSEDEAFFEYGCNNCNKVGVGLELIEKLTDWLLMCTSEALKGISPTKGGHPEDKPLNSLIWNLSFHWEKTTGLKALPNRSKFSEFVKYCLQKINVEYQSDNAHRRRVERVIVNRTPQ